jgi:transcriptional regulator with GAF, ATPase, and Fis domain
MDLHPGPENRRTPEVELAELDPIWPALHENKDWYQVGGTRTLKVNCRWLAATNRDLQQSVKMHPFRSDLYYRLIVFPIRLRRCGSDERTFGRCRAFRPQVRESNEKVRQQHSPRTMETLVRLGVAGKQPRVGE